MPELPEVETIVRGLKARLLGRTVVDVDIRRLLVVKTEPKFFRQSLQNKKIASVGRHGKAIFLSSSKGLVLKIHLGMTGQLLFFPKQAPADAYTRVVFRLDGKNDLHYRDIRQFGRLALVSEAKEKSWGPDAWEVGLGTLFTTLRRKRGMVKHALLNQHVIAGLGNIYVDESLHMAGIHPIRNLSCINDKRLNALCVAIKEVLAESLDLGGTSFRNYVDTNGSTGGFKGRLRVYGKEGNPCPSCGAKIKKMVAAGRGTHYCPRCQVEPRG